MIKEFLLTYYNDTFSVIFYSICLIIIGCIKIGTSIKRKQLFSATNLFVMFFYVFIAIGPIYLILVRDYVYNYNILFIFLVSLICFLIGSELIVGNRLLKTKSFNIFNLKNINHDNVIKNAYIVLVISYLCVFLYLGKNLSFILQNFENNRIIAMQGSGVIIHLAYMMLPATWMIHYCKLNNQKKEKMWKVYMIYIIDILLLFFIGFRSRILELLLLAIIIVNDYKPFKLKKVVIYGMCLILLVSILQVVRTYLSQGIFKLSIDPIINTMAVNSINLKYIFNFFPSRVSFQHGYTFWLSLSILLPNTSMDATLWLKEVLNMQFDGGGVTPSVIGEGFINFGYMGMFIFMTLIGCILKTIDNSSKVGKNNKVVYFIIAFYFARSVSSGLSNFIILIIWFSIVTVAMQKIRLKFK